MHKGAYDFHIDRSKPLAEEAAKAVNVIYSAGLMFRGGALTPGGNNVMADSAANAFSTDELNLLRALDETPVTALLATAIDLRQQYAALDYRTCGVKGDVLLQGIYDTVQTLKKAGWTPKDEPHRVSTWMSPRP